MASQIFHAAASAAINEAAVAVCLLAEAQLRHATAYGFWEESLAKRTQLWTRAANLARRGKGTAAAAAWASARDLDEAHERYEADLAAAAWAVEDFSAVAAAYEAQLLWGCPVPRVREGEQGGLELVATGQEEQPGMGILVGTAEGGVSVVGGHVYGQGQHASMSGPVQGEWAFLQPAPAEADPSAADRVREAFHEKVRKAAAAGALAASATASARSASSSGLAYTGHDWPDGYTLSPCPSPTSPGKLTSTRLRSVEETRSKFREMVREVAEASKPPPPPTVHWWEVADGDDYWSDDEIFIPNILPRRASDGVPCRPDSWDAKKDVPASKKTPPSKSWLVRDGRGK